MITSRKVRIPAEKDAMYVTFSINATVPLERGEGEQLTSDGVAFKIKRNNAIIAAMYDAIEQTQQETKYVIQQYNQLARD